MAQADQYHHIELSGTESRPRVIGNEKEAEARTLLIAAEIRCRASNVKAGLKPQKLC
jgi:hypothetical protein